MSRPQTTLRARVSGAILEAAAALLADRGEQASMADVAAAAGMARATVYRYFPNKEALFEALGRLAVEEAQSVGEVRDDLPAPWLMESLIGIVVSVLQTRPALGVEDTVAGITSLFLDGARLQREEPG